MKYLFFLGQIPSESMQPTFEVRDRVFISRNINNIEAGNVYVFRQHGMLVVKRCIATGGDIVDIIDSKVYINDNLLNEPYIKSDTNPNNYHFEVPEEHYLFLGDNRDNSYDARYWSEPYISKDDIVGEAKFIVFPFTRTGVVR